jgi:DNA-binding SARP family transcriptional activator
MTPIATPPVLIELSGAPRLCAPGGGWHGLERHDAALLAYLAIEGRATRAELAALLWPGTDAARARNSLRQRIFKLKRLAGRSLVDGDDTVALAVGVRTDSPLAPPPTTLGLAHEPSAGDPPAGAPAPELLAACRFDDLDQFDEWLAAARVRWRQARRAAWAAAADAHEQAGRWPQAWTLAQRLRADDGLDEDAHRRLMRLAYLQGDHAGALQAYHDGRRRLADELGVSPGPQTEALARTIERANQAPATGAVPLPVPTPASALPLALRHTPRLVAREAAWQRLDQAWAGAQVLLLQGEPGIGKSRLAQEFARTRPQAVACGARPGDAAQPHALLLRLLRRLGAQLGRLDLAPDTRAELARLLPELGPAARGRAQRERLLDAVVQALAQAGRQGVQGWVLDDLQFADNASLEVLAHWLDDPASEARPHLLLARTGEWPAPIARWCAAARGRRAVELTLGQLDAAGLAELLRTLDLAGLAPAQAPQWAGRIHRHTGGNPLFALQTLVACHEAGGLAAFEGGRALPAPEGVARLLEQRLAQLSPGALRLARALAVAGLELESQAEVLAEVLGCGVADLADAWNELKARQVADDQGFAHDLVMSAVRRGVPQEIARALHGRVGQALAARGQAPARVAMHFREAGLWPQAARHTLRAADQAAAQSRRDDEAELLALAAQCFDAAAQPDDALAARARRIDTLIVAGSLTQARTELAALDDAGTGRIDGADGADGAARTAPAAMRLRLGVLQAKAALEASDGVAGEQAARATHERALALGDRALAFESGLLLASSLSLLGRAGDAMARLQALAPWAASHPDARQRVEFHGAYGYVLGSSGRCREALPHLRTAAELADADGNSVEALTLWTNLSGMLSLAGDLPQAAEVAERARALSVHVGPKQGVAVAANENMLGLAWIALGLHAQAEAVLHDALARFERAGAPIWAVTSENILANLYVLLGQPARALQALRPEPEGTPPARRARRLVVRARIARALGRDGLAELREADALLAGGPQRSVDRVSAMLALAAAVPPDEALALARTARGHCLAQQLDAPALTALAREAAACAAQGDGAAAGAAARTAREDAVGIWPHDLAPSEFWWLLAQAFDAAGQADAAHDAVQRGAAWLRASLPHVPEAYRDGFLHRQPLNRQLLARAAAPTQGRPAA